jgi:hypothetical protein
MIEFYLWNMWKILLFSYHKWDFKKENTINVR